MRRVSRAGARSCVCRQSVEVDFGWMRGEERGHKYSFFDTHFSVIELFCEFLQELARAATFRSILQLWGRFLFKQSLCCWYRVFAPHFITYIELTLWHLRQPANRADICIFRSPFASFIE